MNRWSSSIFAKITLALLFLLKQWALQAGNHRQLSRVLFNEPGKVEFLGQQYIIDENIGKHWDFEQGQHCIDKSITNKTRSTSWT